MASRAIDSRIPWIGSPVDTGLNWTDVWEDVRRGVHPGMDHLFILDCCYGESYCGRDIARLLPIAIMPQDAGQAQFLTSYHVMLAADSSNGNIAYSGYDSLTVVATSKLRDAIWEREGRPNPDGLTIEDLHHLIVSTGRCKPSLPRYGTRQDTDIIRWILVPSLSLSDGNFSDANSDEKSDENSDGNSNGQKSEIDSSEDEIESDESEDGGEEGHSEQNDEIEHSIDGIDEVSDEEYEESEEVDESQTDEDSEDETSQVGYYHHGEDYESSDDQNNENISQYKDWESSRPNLEQNEEELSYDDPGFYIQGGETYCQDVDSEAEVGYWSY